MKKVTIILIVILVLLSVFSIYFFGIGFSPTNLGQVFVNSVRESVRSYEMVDFNELADFQWDRMVIISPYSDVRQVLGEHGVRRPAPAHMRTGIRHSDFAVLLVFVLDNRVVSYVEYPVHHGDFRANRGAWYRGSTRFVSRTDEWGWVTMYHSRHE